MKSNVFIPLVIAGFVLPSFSSAQPSDATQQVQPSNNPVQNDNQAPMNQSQDQNNTNPDQSNSAAPAAPMDPQSTQDATQDAQPAAQLTDAEILGIVGQIDINEIVLADFMIENSQDQDVVNLARMLKKGHHDNIKELKALGIEPTESKKSNKLAAAGKQLYEELRAAHNKSIDKIYVNAMVNGHADALKAINKLKKSTTTQAVSDFLDSTKSAIMDHHKQAEALQGILAQRK